MRYIILIVFFVFYGCSFKEADIIENVEVITYPQDVLLYSSNVNWYLKEGVQDKNTQEYLKHFFSVWEQKEAYYGRDFFDEIAKNAQLNRGFGENLLPHSFEWIEEVIANMNYDEYSSFKKVNGIVLKDSSLRLMPTYKPKFHDPMLAGEGYPFDYWQNSTIYALTPILITHISKDRAWYFVESSFAAGWIEADRVAVIDMKQQQFMKSANFVIALKDLEPLHDKNGHFIDKTRIGKIFLLEKKYENSYVLLLPIAKKKDGFSWQSIHAPLSLFAAFPLPLTQENINLIASELIDKKYGWGGLFENRDCSSMIRDFYGSFGIWLPRNSAAQAQAGEEFIKLPQERSLKEQEIIRYGIPWATLLWLKGHIVLYVGVYQGRAMIFHSIWGIKTLEDGKEGRYILGKSLISDLYLGEQLTEVMKDKLLIDRIEIMRNLFTNDEILREY